MKKVQYLRIMGMLKPIKFEGINLSKIEPIKMKDVIYLEFPEGSTQSIFPFTDMYKSCEMIEIPDINSELLTKTDVKKFQFLGWNVVRTIVLFIAFITTINASSQNLGNAVLGVGVGSGFTLALNKTDKTDFFKVFGSQPLMFFANGVKSFIDVTVINRTPSAKDLLIGQLGSFIGSSVTFIILDSRSKNKLKL